MILNYSGGGSGGIDVPDMTTVPHAGGYILIGNDSKLILNVKFQIAVNRVNMQRPSDPVYSHVRNPLTMPLIVGGAIATVHGAVRSKNVKEGTPESGDNNKQTEVENDSGDENSEGKN